MQLIELAQKHEREWGDQTYTARPTLSEILSMPVVAFWRPLAGNDKREKITIHKDLKDIELFIHKMVFRIQVALPKETLSHVFVKNRLVRVQAIKIQWVAEESSE